MEHAYYPEEFFCRYLWLLGSGSANSGLMQGITDLQLYPAIFGAFAYIGKFKLDAINTPHTLFKNIS